jgi:hypothetical protein
MVELNVVMGGLSPFGIASPHWKHGRQTEYLAWLAPLLSREDR